jgi:FlaA1/EpsC-like NDP-sugar epimerase/lipopolysaccharide/colanic/teichoic acid biosynthesis glycosyltransferase
MGLKKTPRFILLTLGYVCVLHASYLAALLLRFEGDVPQRFWTGYGQIALAFTVLSLAGYFLSGLYHGLWRYASTVTLFQVFKGVTLSAMALGLITLFLPTAAFPRSLIVMVWLWELVLLGGLRFAWRLSRDRLLGPGPRRAVRTLVVGADHTGVHLIQDMRRADGPERLTPIGFIDDEPRFTGHMVEGVRVLGTIADLPRVLHDKRPELLVISDPSMPAKVVREISSFCAQAKVRVKTLPGLSDLQQGRTTLSQMRDMRIEDLLGRQPVQLDLNEVRELVRGQRVLVTGAGGSIGSELARQVSEYGPAELVLLDHAENGLYYVHNEIVSTHPDMPMAAVIADVKDVEAIERVFTRHRPGVVFHAAAHKHVPLLEANPREAVLNNVVGTRNLVRASIRGGVGKFVLISTDKAVNPTSVMGATKRVCEMILQSHSQASRTRFVAVRFGNVLGSEGSVIPLFQRQIQRGGPITVTHPEARRFFMTIPEAVRLVLQAGALGKGGEVLLLDMGEQVRIVDLARQLIRMSGLREHEDVDIVFTGLRPGEKLFEELHSDAERMRITRHERILVWDLDSKDVDTLNGEIAELESLAVQGDSDAIKRQLRRIVPEYEEPIHGELPQIPATPVVELPATLSPHAAPRPEGTLEGARVVTDVVVAAVLLALSLPLWIGLWMESRRLGQRTFLVRETRVGRTRRYYHRRATRVAQPIDRRSIERRTQDLLGEPLRCARFRTDLGPLSRWIGRRRLSALPYLLNVLGCEMSLVGPGPEREENVLRWSGLVPDYDRRFTVRPGVTGLGQLVNVPEDSRSHATRIQYDLFYVDHRTWLLDLRTIVRTADAIARNHWGLGRRGAEHGLALAREAGTAAPLPSPGAPPSPAATVKGVTPS